MSLKLNMNIKFFLIIFFAFFLRLINIHQSLWLDEATTARVVQQYNYLEIVKNFSPFDFHPPLYYLFMKFWTSIFGYSEISLRMPSVIFSLISGWIIFLIGKKIKDEKIGFWASLFFLFNPLIIYYSQEARMYMMATMFLMSGLYWLIKFKNSKFNIKNLLLANLFFSLAFLTFYGSIFFIVSILLYFFLSKEWKNFLISLFIILYLSFIIYPLLNKQLINAKLSLMEVKNWSLVLGKAHLKNVMLIPIKFSIGRIDFYPKWLYYLISGVWTLFVFSLLFNNLKLKIKNLKLKILLLYLLIFPLILGFIASFITPLLQYFRFLYLVPILAILLSFAGDLNKKILFFGFLSFSLIYLIVPQFHREDWKNLSYYLDQNQIKEVFIISSSADPLLYYNKKIKINDLRKICQEINSYNKNQAYILPYSAEIYGLNYENCLAKKFKIFKEKSFRQLKLNEYQISNEIK